MTFQELFQKVLEHDMELDCKIMITGYLPFDFYVEPEDVILSKEDNTITIRC